MADRAEPNDIQETAKEKRWFLASLGQGSTTIIAALIAVFSAVIVVLLTHSANIALEKDKLESNLALEEKKLKSRLILKSVETRDQKDALKMMLFLVKIGLLEYTPAIKQFEENPDLIPLRPPSYFEQLRKSFGDSDATPGFGDKFRSHDGETK